MLDIDPEELDTQSRLVPCGVHLATIIQAIQKPWRNDLDQIEVTFQVGDKRIRRWFYMSKDGQRLLCRFLVYTGFTLLKNPDDLVGKQVGIIVEDGEYDGSPKREVVDFCRPNEVNRVRQQRKIKWD